MCLYIYNMTELEKLHLIVRLSKEAGVAVAEEVAARIRMLEDKLLEEIKPEPVVEQQEHVPNASRYGRMENLLQEKEVDWSVLQYGLTVPKEFHKAWYSAIGEKVRRGKSIHITLITNCKSFKVQLLNSNDVLQVRYSSNSEVAQFFQKAFQRSFDYISAERKKHPGTQVHLPQGEKQILQVFRTDKERTLFISGIDECEQVGVVAATPVDSHASVENTSGSLSSQEKKFRKFLDRNIAPKTVGSYMSAMPTVSEYIRKHVDSSIQSVYEIVDVHQMKSCYEVLRQTTAFVDFNRDAHNRYSAAIGKYIAFLSK